MFRAEISYTSGGEPFNLCSDNKQELIGIVSNLVFTNPGVYQIIPIYGKRAKLFGLVGPDGKYKDKD